MYYQNYEDYMRTVLGYPIENQNTYESYNYSSMPYEVDMYSDMTNRYHQEIQELYPDIYKIVNPMVIKICEANTSPITRELLEKMTDEIYMNLESQPDIDTVVNVRVNTSKDSKVADSSKTSKTEEISRSGKSVKSSSSINLESSGLRNEKSSSNTSIIDKNIREDRQRRPNNNLRDLIRILILNQLLRPQFPPRPPRPRPPFPGPGPRPPRPLFPRDNMNYNDFLI